MKRHAALHDLGRDHHDILLHARRLLGEDKRVKGETAWERFNLYRDAVLGLHLDEEERFILGRVEPGLASRWRLIRHELEHATGPAQVGKFLRLHARFCEDTLFPAMEQELGDAAWKAYAHEALAFRRNARPDSIGKDRAEACYL